MIERILEKQILAKINTNKAIILLGSRQVGKTTLLKSLFENSSETIWLNADEPDIQAIFANISSKRFEAIIGNKKMIIMNEAFFNRNEICILQLIFHHLSFDKLNDVGHQFSLTKIQRICISVVLDFRFLQMDVWKCLLINHLSV